MSYQFRFPQITGATEREQLEQIKRYLYQFSEQLQYVVNDMGRESDARIDTVVRTAAANKQAPHDEARATFNSIKSLIIKSADIVNAYSETIEKKLSGAYVAQSDFGEFKQFTESKFTAYADKLTQEYYSAEVIDSELAAANSYADDKVGAAEERLNVQIGGAEERANEKMANLSGDVDSKLSGVEMRTDEKLGYMDERVTAANERIDATNTTVREVTAYIKTGLLYEDAEIGPVYGLEIMQRTERDGVDIYDACARFVPNRLSFFDSNNIEVAYISDYRLHITHAEIENSLTIGGYLLDTSHGGLAFKWA